MKPNSCLYLKLYGSIDFRKQTHFPKGTFLIWFNQHHSLLEYGRNYGPVKFYCGSELQTRARGLVVNHFSHHHYQYNSLCYWRDRGLWGSWPWRRSRPTGRGWSVGCPRGRWPPAPECFLRWSEKVRAIFSPTASRSFEKVSAEINFQIAGKRYLKLIF